MKNQLLFSGQNLLLPAAAMEVGILLLVINPANSMRNSFVVGLGHLRLLPACGQILGETLIYNVIKPGRMVVVENVESRQTI